MPNFTEWNYDTGIATEYERIGECNRCGDCCRSVIDIKITKDGNKRYHGGKTTNEEGRWSEIMEVSDVAHIKENREFIAFIPTDREHGGCHALDPETSLCTINSGFSKPWCCSVFPTAPSDIKNLPNCSYEFIKVNEYSIEELEYAPA